MKVFVTVGTTKFEDLIEVINSHEFLQLMIKNDVNKLVVQYGNGFKPELLSQAEYTYNNRSLELESFDFLPSLQEKFLESDLIISHGGLSLIYS